MWSYNCINFTKAEIHKGFIKSDQFVHPVITRAGIGTGLLLIITNCLFVLTINVRIPLFGSALIGTSFANCLPFQIEQFMGCDSAGPAWSFLSMDSFTGAVPPSPSLLLVCFLFILGVFWPHGSVLGFLFLHASFVT